jgi:hypothetical protein
MNAMSDDIYWFSGREGYQQHVLWIDDQFFPSDPSGRRDTPAFNHEWFAQDDWSSSHDAVAVLADVKKKCEQRRIGLAVTSFGYCEQHLEELVTEGALLLMDVQNLDAPSGMDRELYGYRFVASSEALRAKLLASRLRFFTRYQRETMRRANELHGLGLTDDHYLTPLPTGATSLARWLDSWLLHREPVIADALRFYAQPWAQGSPYKWNSPPQENHDAEQWQDELARWLRLPPGEVDKEDSKSLLIWRLQEGEDLDERIFGDYYQSGAAEVPESLGEYCLSVPVLEALLRKLEISSDGLDKITDIYMPLCPSLPFFLALWLLGKDVRKEGPKVVWSQANISEDTRICRIGVICDTRNWEPRDSFYRLTRGQGHTAYLRNLIRYKVAEVDLREGEDWRAVFAVGTKHPAFGVAFTGGCINLFWLSQTPRPPVPET